MKSTAAACYPATEAAGGAGAEEGAGDQAGNAPGEEEGREACGAAERAKAEREEEQREVPGVPQGAEENREDALRIHSRHRPLRASLCIKFSIYGDELDIDEIADHIRA